MKHYFKIAPVLLLAMTLLATGSAQAADSRAIHANYPATRLTDRVYVIYGPMGEPTVANQGFRNNIVFVVTDDGVVVMDPGTSVYVGNMALEKIRGVTRKPVVAVFNSHVHGDHWLGNEAFKEANPKVKIYAHPNMIKQARAGEGRYWLKLFNETTNNAVVGTTPVPPSIGVKDGQKIRIGGVTFLVHETGPAHSDGDIMIEIPQEQVFFTGDIIRSGMIGISEISFKGYLNATRRILQTESKIYIPGHGKAGDKKIVLAYHNLINTLHETVVRLYGEGLADYQIKPYVVNALTEYKDWLRFNEHIGRLVSLAYLEAQADAFN